MNYNDIDFAKLFTEQKKLSSIRVKSPKGWDLKASYMNKRVAKSVYNEMFLQRMDLSSCKSLLDFGCGTGNISLKIAHKLHKIYAIDSSPKMIQTYEKNAKNINNVKTYVQDINDTWDIPKCDIVIASRSINSILDVKKALIKLDSYAKKRVYLTYKTNFSFYDKKLYDFLGKEVVASPDYIHILIYCIRLEFMQSWILYKRRVDISTIRHMKSF